MRAANATAGALLRQAGRGAELTQHELAARAGITQSAVSAQENGSREPSLATLAPPVVATIVSLELHLGEGPVGGVPLATGPVGRRLSRRRAAVLAVAARHGMTELHVFGSVARGQDTDSSDLDLLVRVPEGTGLLALGRFTQELEDLLGVPADVVPQDGVKPRVRRTIERDLVPL